MIIVHSTQIIYLVFPKSNMSQRNCDYNNQYMQELLNQPPHFSQGDTLTQKQAFMWIMHSENEIDSWMHEYLKGQRPQYLYEEQNHVSLVLESFHTNYAPETCRQPQTLSAAPSQGHSKSVFHNYQKNLLCLLKRVISIKRQELIKAPFGIEAYSLWKWFLDEGLYCKKSLYVTFGVKFSQNGKLIRKMALSSQSLQKLVNKYGMNSIQQSQKLLRETVHRIASQLEKHVLEKMCKVKDFPTFYRYFLIFIDELSQGALSQRLSKDQKAKHMKSLQQTRFS